MIDVIDGLLQKSGHVVVVQLVVDLASSPFPYDETKMAKGPELMRDSRLLHIHSLSKIADGTWTFYQPSEYQYSTRRGECMHHLRHIPSDITVDSCGRHPPVHPVSHVRMLT